MVALQVPGLDLDIDHPVVLGPPVDYEELPNAAEAFVAGAVSHGCVHNEAKAK